MRHCYFFPQNYQPGVVYSNEEKVDVLWTDGIIYPSVVKSRDEFLRFDVCIGFLWVRYYS